MGLQIIGAGYGRTGTSSTKIALEVLGFPCYHMTEVLSNEENVQHLNFWNTVANSPEGHRHNWKEVFSKYQATVDNPGCAVWKELYKYYPDAKIVLTLHPKGATAWYDSAYDTIYSSEVLWQYKLLKLFVPYYRKFGNMASKLIWKRLHRGTMRNKEVAVALYHQHVEEVKSIVPANRLLIFSADQGWGPLCEFLNLPVPNQNFPRVNERAKMKKLINDEIRKVNALVAFVSLVILVILFCLYFYVE